MKNQLLEDVKRRVLSEGAFQGWKHEAREDRLTEEQRASVLNSLLEVQVALERAQRAANHGHIPDLQTLKQLVDGLTD